MKPIEITMAPRSGAGSRSVKRTMGLEPTTLSLGSLSSAAWLVAIPTVTRNQNRTGPLGTAGIEGRLARNWRARNSVVAARLPVV
jgi:hypothetical protein